MKFVLFIVVVVVVVNQRIYFNILAVFFLIFMCKLVKECLKNYKQKIESTSDTIIVLQ